jgi:hypothetical protein
MEKKRKPSFSTNEVKTGFHIWSQISLGHKLNKEHVGKRVWVAGEFKTKERVLIAVHKKGERFWPEGGYEVHEVDRGITRYYPFRKCRLHPDELKRKRKQNIKL